MIIPNKGLELRLIRQSRKRKRKMPTMLGEMVDSYEAMLNDLQLQLSMLTAQSEIERQKAEILANQITVQVKLAEEQILKFLNQYSKSIVDKVYSQVKVSEESLKFKDSDLYDMSFISNMDYSKIQLFNDKSLLESRIDNREVYRKKMIEMKLEVTFHQGLIKNTADNDTMLPDLYNARNYYLREYYLACIAFYQEATVLGFLQNPTNNLENLKEFLTLNEKNIPIAKSNLEAKRISIGEEAYAKEASRLKYTERMYVTAKYRLKYLTQAYEGKWQPPTFESLTKYAEEKNITYSRAVYDLNESSRQTLCVPDWIVSLAEMYNQIEVFEQGADVVPLNPYNPIWLRKARSVINLESEGVKYTAEKLSKSIDKYWEVLTGGFQSLEDYHVDAILVKALAVDNSPVVGYQITTDYDLVSFDEDQQMGGFFKKVFKGIVSVGRTVFEATVKVGGVVLKAASPITKIATNTLKFTLDNSLGRVLPDSVYKKISGLTNAGAAIVEGNLTTANFRGVVKGVMDINLIGLRIGNEAMLQAMKIGFVRTIDKYSGGLLTSTQRLGKVPIKLQSNEKVDWRVTLIDALKVGSAVMAGGAMVATTTGSSYVGEKTGLDQTSLGKGVLTAGALMATGQADFSTVASSGATQVGTKAVVNNTALGDSMVGRTVAELGIVASVNSIQANTAFSEEIRNRAEDKAREIATKKANAVIQQETGLPLNVKMLESAYDFATGDVTMEEIYTQAKEKYTKKFDELLAKAENLSLEEVERKATKEADKFVLDQLDKTKNKYGQEMFDYLISKYGPKLDYDDVATPDDYLNYQIFTPDPERRVVNIIYKSNAVKIATGVMVVGVVASLFALNQDA